MRFVSIFWENRKSSLNLLKKLNIRTKSSKEQMKTSTILKMKSSSRSSLTRSENVKRHWEHAESLQM